MSAAGDLEEFYVHEVTVDTFTGSGAWGDTYTTNGPARCFIDDSRQLVRDAQGNETVSETSITLPLEYREWFTPGSHVHLPHRDADVISVSIADSGELDLPDHVEIALT